MISAYDLPLPHISSNLRGYMQDFLIYAPPPAVQWALLWQSDDSIMQPYKFIELYTNFLLHIYMILFILQLTSPHVQLEMLGVYLYQELEPP